MDPNPRLVMPVLLSSAKPLPQTPPYGKRKISKVSLASGSQPLVPLSSVPGLLSISPMLRHLPKPPPLAVLPTKRQKIASAKAAGMEHPSPPTQVTAASASRRQFLASTCSPSSFLGQTLQFLTGADFPFLCPKHILQPDKQLKLVDNCCPTADQSHTWVRGAAAHGPAHPRLFAGQIFCLNNSAEIRGSGRGGKPEVFYQFVAQVDRIRPFMV